MRNRVISMVVIIPLILLQNYGIGHGESEIAKTFAYELPVAEGSLYESHAVTFAHARHAMEFKIPCARCHHTLAPGAAAVEETCVDCHVKNTGRHQPNRTASGEERIRLYLPALHDLCIDCHREVNQYNADAQAPLACWKCHIRKKK